MGPQRFAVCRMSRRVVCVPHQEVGALSLGSARGSGRHGAWGLYRGPEPSWAEQGTWKGSWEAVRAETQLPVGI